MLNTENKQGSNQSVSTNGAQQDPAGTGGSPIPSLSLPKGGGAIRGVGEKFSANPVTGTGSMSVPIATSSGRSGFVPQLSLSYDSGAGNGPFGFGWHLALPAITRKTDKGLPHYNDAAESDVFILSGSEDLVPQLVQEHGQWRREQIRRTLDDGSVYTIQHYRPRIEGLFARIERWTNERTGEIHWRSITRDNITTLYGKCEDARIADPAEPSHIFSWLICESFDDRGNAIVYEYKAEDSANVDLSQPQERNRTPLTRSANRYLKRVRYGNLAPYQPGEDLSRRTDMCFEVVFDYGEHDDATPTPQENMPWPIRLDAFSTYRACFEIRTYRLCRRVLMFHRFPEEAIGQDALVHSTDFHYIQGSVASFIRSIVQSGYTRQRNNIYRKKSLPPLEFAYSQVEIDETIRIIAPEQRENLPYGMDGSHYRWIDLDGEGISGILTEQGGAWFYAANEGHATFSPAQVLHTRPSLANLNGGRQQLLDLAGDGHVALAEFAQSSAGFYERSPEDGWRSFQTFASLPTIDWADPNLRFVDLTGDGLADVLITDQNVFTWYPSLGHRGFGEGESTFASLNEERGPALVFADGEQSIYLADMSGDGLLDLVRIRNGEVCYWPDLGYGHFGAKITMDNAPWFDMPDLFDQRRVRLADIDGSGTTDIIYLGATGVKLFFNQSGNSLSERRILAEFPRVDSLASVNVVDLFGNGTACIVWSSPLPSDARQPMRYIDLMGRQKPHLLISTKNNLGSETSVQYTSSTEFYLHDRAQGTPWVTRLPFPVSVIQRMEIYDQISNNRFITRYAYHHGYYDGYEREFRGFGMVEQWDTEEIGTAKIGTTSHNYANIDASSFVPPVHTKTWFHTGAYIAQDNISRHYAHEYYKGDALAIILPDTLLPEGLTNEEQGEACRALKGSLLRQEIYAEDGTAKSQHPYSVSENNYTINWIQARGINRHAVFFVHARETLDYHYERIFEPAHDPRVSHQVVLDVDAFGNIRQSIAIGYGRRSSSLASTEDREQQTQTLVTYTHNQFTNAVRENDAYHTPLLYESHTCELTGHGYSEQQKPSLNRLLEDTAHAAPLEYSSQPDGGLQKRLIEHVRTLYRKDDLSAPLPLGRLESMALPYESYKQAFTPTLLTQVYGNRIADTMLSEGGYVHSEHDDNWWIPAGRVFYRPDPQASPVQELAFARSHFFLPHRFEDPFGNSTFIAYDAYALLPISSRDALDNETHAEYDYRVLQPRAIIDPNRNHSEAVFDTLGLLAGTAILGKVEDGKSESGDSLAGFVADVSDDQLQAFVRAPKDVALQLLGSATTRIIYDLQRFQKDGQPVFGATLARERHVHIPGGPQSPVQVSLTYSDGFGREAQTKIQAEPGDAPLREANTNNPDIPGTLLLKDGKPVLAPANPRWVGKGRTVYNNKGKPIKQYEPFFSSTHLYESEAEMVMTGVTPILFYDPIDRVVATLHPNHTYQKAVFDPWQQTTWDVNDTVLQTDPANDPDVGNYFQRLPQEDYLPTWYAQRQDGALGKQEQEAAHKTALHANTPTTAHFDMLGRSFLTVVQNRFKRDDTIVNEAYSTRVVLDIEGNQREVTDARSRLVMRYDYDMLSHRIHQSSMEAGQRWMLNDVAGKTVYTWDSREHRLHTVYDALRRATEVYLREDNGQRLLVERTVYGEKQPDAEGRNLRGKTYQGFDGAGILSVEAYDFKGNLLQGNRQVAREYKQTLDWSKQVELEERIYTSSTSYDALNRPVTLRSPDNSVIRPTYNEANLLERVDGNLCGSTENTAFVRNLDYDAKGQRTLIEYGNGTHTQYEYDPETFRLTHLLTLRGASFPDDCPQPHRSDCGVQNLHYTYDPTGNITSIRDDAQQTVYFHNRKVEPSAEYTYDAIYRLIVATGREHLGQSGHTSGGHLFPVPTSHTDAPRVNLPQPGDGNAMGRYSEQYEYDEVGNILRMLHAGSHPTNPGWTRFYSYHEASQLEPDRHNNRLSSTHTGEQPREPYTYDVHGNMTTMPHLPLMQWDYRDQLQATAQQFVSSGTTPETTYYVYDAKGQRVRKVTERQSDEETPTRKVERIYVGNFEVYHEYSGDGTTVTLERETLHIMDDKQRVALIETRTQGNDESPAQLTRYQFGNHLGSAVLELDDQGQIISYEEYYPYSSTSYQAVRNQIETPKRYRYTGKERDEENGLYYHGARYYACWLGRWSNCDPLGIGDGENLFAFVQNNPIGRIDRTGKAGSNIIDDIFTFIRNQAGFQEGAKNPPTIDVASARANAGPSGVARHAEATGVVNDLRQVGVQGSEQIYSEVAINKTTGVVTKIGGSPIAGHHNIDLVAMPEGSQPLVQNQSTLSAGQAEVTGDIKYGRGSITQAHASFGKRGVTVNDRFNATPSAGGSPTTNTGSASPVASTPSGPQTTVNLSPKDADLDPHTGQVAPGPNTSAAQARRAASAVSTAPAIEQSESGGVQPAPSLVNVAGNTATNITRATVPGVVEAEAAFTGGAYVAYTTGNTALVTPLMTASEAVPIVGGSLVAGAVVGNLAEAGAKKLGASTEVAQESGAVAAMLTGAGVGALIGSPTGIGAPIGAVIGGVVGLGGYYLSKVL